ncbi:SLBB domain-containing protein [Vibrio tubiashii]|uniref:SLBB domain-containing protein n=1 Tax=Vibrio tubiashii TaxID=29498 RepID=UPI001EFEB3B2|nr:SLBB domain-containing protein [Vibrio tubiashii]MCG9576163.1 SLBB domain-containing protein [Vibrio tubiashii]
MSKSIKSIGKLTVLGLMSLSSTLVSAATPTAAQIAQFQSLPKAQQEQLARQMGVDVSSFTSSQTAASDEKLNEPKALERVTTEQQPKPLPTQSTKPEDSLPHFGYNFFSGEALDFTPVDNLPVPLNYKIAPGDVIRLQLFGKSYNDYKLKVDREGKITIPEFGPEYVAGQSFEELRNYVNSLTKRKAIGVDAVVSLSEMRAIQVFVTGDVKQPGAYNVNGLTTLSQVLVAVGGINLSGSLRDIQVKHPGKKTIHFDAYDLIVRGDSSNDIRLQSGDTILIPTKKSSVSISGEVLRPAYYELKSDETLQDLVEIAGGALPTAYLSKVTIKRQTETGVQPLTFDLSQSKGKAIKIKSGDDIVLLPTGKNIKNAIALRGELFRQGAYQYQSGLKISDVISRDDLKENADLSYSLLVREVSNSSNIEVWQFQLQNLIDNPTAPDNFELQKGDQIFVFDNGIDVNYWYREDKSNSRKRAESPNRFKDSENSSKRVSKVDAQTGALVEKEVAQELAISDIDEFAVADEFKLSSRESLLKPIIERLKSQASLNEQAKIFEISGAVKYPGVYPLAENSSFDRIIAATGGFAEQAFLYSAELSRSEKKKDDYVVSHIEFSPQEVIDGQRELEVKPQDRIIVKTQPNWQRGNSIELQGEVVFPGTYTFQRGETIQDVIERAGGLTQYAYLPGAVFSRESLRRQEEERLKLLNLQLKQEIANLSLRRQNSSATYTTSPTEAMKIADELSSVEAIGRLVINLPEALAGNLNADLMLEKGDKLYIPAKQPIVSVMGEVQFSSNHTFTPNMTIEDYISSAGGTKKQADTDRIYVVRADGSVMLPNSSFWFSRKSQPLEPGDTIIVPLDTDYLDGLSTLTSATQILYQIGVAWSAVKN